MTAVEEQLLARPWHFAPHLNFALEVDGEKLVLETVSFSLIGTETLISIRHFWSPKCSIWANS